MDSNNKLSQIDNSTILKKISKNSLNYLIFKIFLSTKFSFISYIVNDNFELELASKEIEFYSKEIKILKFPEWNTIPYDVSSPQLKIQTDRMRTIYELLNLQNISEKKILFIISKNALFQKIINKKDYKYLNISVNQKISIEEMKKLLEDNCYEQTETSISLGDFSINNNTIDFITFNELAYRITIKNNTIEEIKNFNSNSQITINNYQNILITPIREVIFNKENINNFKQNYRNFFEISYGKDIIYDNISNGTIYNGFENWLPLFYNNNLESIFDYISNNSLFIFSSNIYEKIQNSLELMKKYYELRLSDVKQLENKMLYNPIDSNLLYLTYEEVCENIDKYKTIIFDVDNLSNINNAVKLNFEDIPNFFQESKEVFKDLQEYLNDIIN